MKKTSTFMAILFMAVACAPTVNAQYASVENKKIVLPYLHTNNEIENTRPLKKFVKEFPDATDDKWIKTRRGFFVSFTLKGILNKAWLNKTGYCETLIRYYTEKELPADVRHQVKSIYYDYSIASVQEVVTNNTIAYLVTMEDKTSWRVIRVVNGEMDVWQESLKAN